MRGILSSKKIRLVLIFFQLCLSFYAQQQKIPMKDSLDGHFDLSDFLIYKKGFVPVPVIITEPALGGFGGGIVPIFITQNPPYVDSVNGKQKITQVAPNITGGVAIYTANKSWLTAAFRQGTFVKSRIKYTAGGGYGNINMSFYRTVENQGEKEFAFNLKSIVLLLQASKRIKLSHWYAGVKYLFLKADVKYTGDRLLSPDFVKPIEYKSIVSQLGAVVELDNRDNTFTPDKGLKVHLDVTRSDHVFGSDYEYWRLNYFTNLYMPLHKKLIGGLRIDGQQAFGEPPFFMLPYVDMRGIPVYRYQGKADLLTEAELRWDFINRWSLMFYSGMGKAFNKWNEFGDAELVYSYGTGFRYLVARKFKLRMGVDIARGPEQWAYYIVFGSNWLK